MATDYNKLVYSSASSTPYKDMFTAYKKGQEAQRLRDIEQRNLRQEQQIASSNAQYDSTAKQNYINYMQGRKNLPSQLNALGIRGGASESSLLRLGTNYGSNVASNEAARNTALNNIRTQFEQEAFDYDKAYNEDLTAKQTAYAEKQRDWEQQQLEKNLQYFSSAIKGQYNSKKGYENLIKQLQASNDPNKVAKIMLTRQAMNEWLAQNKSSGGGGGGSRRSYGYGGGYSSGGGSGSSGSGRSDVSSALKNSLQAFNNANKAMVSATKSSAKKKNNSKNWTYGHSISGELMKYKR